MSPASLATSVPEPMAKPTSAFFRAGESFTPSPVMPTTRFSSWAMRTSRLLSVGRARATTRRLGRSCLSSSSVFSAISALVMATSVVSRSRPDSRAMATAVSLRSPVTMTTWMPASCTSLIAGMTSLRTLSRMERTQTSVRSRPSGSPSVLATPSRRMERPACASM